MSNIKKKESDKISYNKSSLNNNYLMNHHSNGKYLEKPPDLEMFSFMKMLIKYFLILGIFHKNKSVIKCSPNLT